MKRRCTDDDDATVVKYSIIMNIATDFAGWSASGFLCGLSEDVTSRWHGVPRDIINMVDAYVPRFLHPDEFTFTRERRDALKSQPQWIHLVPDSLSRVLFDPFTLLNDGLLNGAVSLVGKRRDRRDALIRALSSIEERFHPWLFDELSKTTFNHHVNAVISQCVGTPATTLNFVCAYIERGPTLEHDARFWVAKLAQRGLSSEHGVSLCAALARHVPRAVWTHKSLWGPAFGYLRGKTSMWASRSALLARRLLHAAPDGPVAAKLSFAAILDKWFDKEAMLLLFEWLDHPDARIPTSFGLPRRMTVIHTDARDQLCAALSRLLVRHGNALRDAPDAGRAIIGDIVGAAERLTPPLIELIDAWFRLVPEVVVECMSGASGIQLLENAPSGQLSPVRRAVIDSLVASAQRLGQLEKMNVISMDVDP